MLTKSELDQYDTERIVISKINQHLALGPLCLDVEAHVKYLLSSLDSLSSSSFVSLDSSRTWIQYWIWHALRLLKYNPSPFQHKAATEFISLCQSSKGGFAGSPMPSLPHTIATYSAVMALMSIGTNESFSVINRQTLKSFLISMKHSNGSFHSHEDGECDIRAAYCAISVASICNILSDDLIQNTRKWIVTCQTPDGGFAGVPGGEAHAGYTYCGVACLSILNDWAGIDRTIEGGFDGRPNKLVDSCYSFWVLGAIKVIGHEYVSLANSDMLRRYVLGACQRRIGGLRDKPGKHVDFYHTCYSLSGLSVADKDELDAVDARYNVVKVKTILAEQYFSQDTSLKS
ncbi:hypothetical protein GEMRC1_013792 [Eukaryota sp. GEM-RC1]